MVNRSTSRPGNGAVTAIHAAFAANGALFASWVSRIPAVRTRLDASEPELGVVLLGIAAGALVAMPMTGWLCERFGIRRVLIPAVVACAGSFQFAVAAPSIPLLGVALVLVGLSYGTWDVAMNAGAHRVENDTGRILMPRFHGAFSVGGLAGAGLGALAAAAGLAAWAHLVIVGSAVAMTAVAIAPRVPHRVTVPVADFAEAADETTPHRTITARLVVLGLLTACTTLGEGAAADWSAIFLHDERSAPESTAALAYAGFAAAMAIGRFAGTWTLSRMTRVTAIRTSGFLVFGSVILLVGIDSAYTGIAAMLGWGLGAALIFPAAMSASAENNARPAQGMAVVATIGYGGFIVGPPTIGFIGGAAGLGVGLLVVGLLGLVTVVLAPVGGHGRVVDETTGRPPDRQLDTVTECSALSA
jgi:MFS family permease